MHPESGFLVEYANETPGLDSVHLRPLRAMINSSVALYLRRYFSFPRIQMKLTATPPSDRCPSPTTAQKLQQVTLLTLPSEPPPHLFGRQD